MVTRVKLVWKSTGLGHRRRVVGARYPDQISASGAAVAHRSGGPGVPSSILGWLTTSPPSFSGLGCRSLKAKTLVQIQEGVPHMQIVKALPPNIEAIAAAFPVNEMLAKHDVWFCWGETIFNPRGGKIPEAILAHERVHSRQQEPEGPTAWWGRYLTDPTFRLAQEVAAYAAEFRWHVTHADTSRRIRGFRSP